MGGDASSAPGVPGYDTWSPSRAKSSWIRSSRVAFPTSAGGFRLQPVLDAGSKSRATDLRPAATVALERADQLPRRFRRSAPCQRWRQAHAQPTRNGRSSCDRPGSARQSRGGPTTLAICWPHDPGENQAPSLRGGPMTLAIRWPRQAGDFVSCWPHQADHPGRALTEFFPSGVPAQARFMSGRGCASCRNTGYRGRIALLEFWELDVGARQLIERSATS
jgi:hypothetical protein